MTRAATPEDVDHLCAGLPETELGVSWGDVPTWKVGGRGFVLYRHPRKDALDPATGEPFPDLLVVRTPSMEDKAALVEAEGPFFTIDHFRSFAAVLVQLSRLGEIGVDELDEVIRDAWRAVAPKPVLRRHPEV